MQVYCDMEGINCDGEGGWTRVAYINMTESDSNCPTGLVERNYTSNRQLCGRKNDNGCSSANFSSIGLLYSEVCGQVRGYQYGSPDGFHDASKPLEINSFYVDGVSIVYGKNTSRHIWTYAVGLHERQRDSHACPCNTNYTGTIEPNSTFIKSHYYCESGIPNGIKWDPVRLHANDPLWDGQQCRDNEAPCCPTNSTMPWFYRSLEMETSDDIELRVCGNEFIANEDTPLDIIELYIK